MVKIELIYKQLYSLFETRLTLCCVVYDINTAVGVIR